MKPKVIVYNQMPEDLLSYIGQSCDIRYYENLESADDPHFLEDLNDAAGLIGAGLQVNEKLLNHAPKLKIVCNVSVGYNNLDIRELTDRKVMASNTPDVLTETTADTIFGLLIATARRMPELDHIVKEGCWKEKNDVTLFGSDVHHKTLGIIGMGRIGRAIANRAHHGFHMNILYHNRSRDSDAEKAFDAAYQSLDELLTESDFVCLMTPLTPETEHLIGKREFQLMKKTAIFINGSRGQTVNEKDLVEALKNEDILAAGLDVYQQEPVSPDHPLLRLNQVVTLPHIGSATAETRYKMAKLAAENLVQGVNGSRPPSLINEEVFGNK